jgi:hypothetical protein
VHYHKLISLFIALLKIIVAEVPARNGNHPPPFTRLIDSRANVFWQAPIDHDQHGTNLAPTTILMVRFPPMHVEQIVG